MPIKEWLRKLLRPRLPPGQQYVDDTDSGKLYLSMRKRCPACGLKPPEWMKGPEGGACVNIFCGRCGEGYNITPMVEVAEKIGRNDRYILPQYKESSRAD